MSRCNQIGPDGTGCGPNMGPKRYRLTWSPEAAAQCVQRSHRHAPTAPMKRSMAWHVGARPPISLSLDIESMRTSDDCKPQIILAWASRPPKMFDKPRPGEMGPGARCATPIDKIRLDQISPDRSLSREECKSFLARTTVLIPTVRRQQGQPTCEGLFGPVLHSDNFTLSLSLQYRWPK